MSIINTISNEEITLVQGVGGLFLCEESWVTQNLRNTRYKNILDKEMIIAEIESINTEHPETGLLDLP